MPIDGALLRTKGLANLEQVRSEIGFMWRDEKRFLAQGFGVAAVFDDADRLLVYRRICQPNHVRHRHRNCGRLPEPGCGDRGRAALRAHALARGVTPHWECDAENLPSIRVAEKAGFTFLEESTFWAGLFDA